MTSNKDEQLWVWEYESEDGKHDMFMDIDEEIRFRVIEEIFVDTSPSSGECEHATWVCVQFSGVFSILC